MLWRWIKNNYIGVLFYVIIGLLLVYWGGLSMLEFVEKDYTEHEISESVSYEMNPYNDVLYPLTIEGDGFTYLVRSVDKQAVIYSYDDDGRTLVGVTDIEEETLPGTSQSYLGYLETEVGKGYAFDRPVSISAPEKHTLVIIDCLEDWFFFFLSLIIFSCAYVWLVNVREDLFENTWEQAREMYNEEKK